MDINQFKPSVQLTDNANEKIGLAPLVGDSPEILILGSLPGDESIKAQQYYANSNNLFWRLLADIFKDSQLLVCSYDEKIERLKAHKIALWDVYKSAERRGSKDRDIYNPIPNDIKQFIIDNPSIKVIGLNGKRAYEEFCRQFADVNIPIVKLLSSSPLNASFKYPAKVENWSKLLER